MRRYCLFIKAFYCPQQCGNTVHNTQNSSSGLHCSEEVHRAQSVKSCFAVIVVAIVWYEEVFYEGTRRENVIVCVLCGLCVGWSGSRMNKASSRSCNSWETPSLQTQPRRELCSRYPHLHSQYLLPVTVLKGFVIRGWWPYWYWKSVVFFNYR